MPTLNRTVWFLLLGLFAGFGAPAQPPLHAADEFDVVIYGGTSAAVTAAIQTQRMGKSAVIIEPGQHIGGLTVSGLGFTDTGNKSVIGGLAREFYQRVKQHYDNPAAWPHEERGGYSRYRTQDDAMWTFEPHVAETIIKTMLESANVTVVLGESLDRKRGVAVKRGEITAITMTSGRKFTGKRFVDATYEGDLLAAAGVSFHVGRESNETYGETLNGVQTARAIHHQFIRDVDPYKVPGDPSSGLLPGIGDGPGEEGSGDHRMQAYNYRICMTDVRANQIPWPKPDDYDPELYELLLRNFEAGDPRLPLSIGMMPNRKTDVNNNHAVSTDFIGMNYDYPEASDAERKEILRLHRSYVQGLFWTLANHPRVPESIRREVSRWGLAADEFVDNDHWPYWCYIREGRRMVSDYVQTELDCRRKRMCDDSVGLGSYNMDSHNTQRYVTEEGYVRNEGDVQVSPGGPYLVSYRAIVPRREEVKNLLVPVCLSSSHIAYGSIRMEPVFMILGQSAATAACLSIDSACAVQDVPYESLRERLLADNQVLDIPPGSVRSEGIHPKSLAGIVIDDSEAEKQGPWGESSSVGTFVGSTYAHDQNQLKGEKTVRFKISVEKPGRYEVRYAYTANANRATNVPVTVRHRDGEETVTVNQRKAPAIDKVFVRLGTFSFGGEGEEYVLVTNAGTDGYVIADAVQLLPVE